MEAILAEAAAMAMAGGGPARGASAGEGRIWTLWSAGVALTFGLPAALLIWIEPLALPVALIFLGHGVAVLHLQARRGRQGCQADRHRSEP